MESTKSWLEPTIQKHSAHQQIILGNSPYQLIRDGPQPHLHSNDEKMLQFVEMIRSPSDENPIRALI